MKVKDVKQKIEQIQHYYDNLIKLQEYFLLHTCNDCDVEKEVSELRSKLEEDANLSIPVRDLMSATAKCLGDEMGRLKKIIDDTDVRI